MEPTRIIAVRHGETAWNIDARLQGHIDIPLNDVGLHQARQVAQALAHEPVDAIYSSDLLRAWGTAQAIANTTGAPLFADPGMRERNCGTLQGLTFAEIEAQYPEKARLWRERAPEFAPDNGESLIALRDRINASVARIANKHGGALLVLVAHGGVLDMLYRAATGQGVQAPRTWKLTNGAINRLLWTSKGLSLVDWADTQHLDTAGREETIT